MNHAAPAIKIFIVLIQIIAKFGCFRAPDQAIWHYGLSFVSGINMGKNISGFSEVIETSYSGKKTNKTILKASIIANKVK